MPIEFVSSPRPTIGVEMELELIDRDSRELVKGAHEILAEMGAPHGQGGHPKAKPELLQSTVEIITGICDTAGGARDDLAATLAELRTHTEPRNLEIICSGTHPFSDPAGQEISPDPRYLRLVNEMQWPAKQMQIFGIHVHVGVRSGEKAISMVNALSAYIPHFLALSASSPFWMGHETGMASWRSKVFESLPTAGPPWQLNGWPQFEQLMETSHLVANHQDHPRGLVGHPPASELRHGRDPRLRRHSNPARGGRRRRAEPVPRSPIRCDDRSRLHAADAPRMAGEREQVARGATRAGRVDHSR